MANFESRDYSVPEGKAFQGGVDGPQPHIDGIVLSSPTRSTYQRLDVSPSVVARGGAHNERSAPTSRSLAADIPNGQLDVSVNPDDQHRDGASEMVSNGEKHQATFEGVQASLARRKQATMKQLPGIIAGAEHNVARFEELNGRAPTDEESRSLTSAVSLAEAAIIKYGKMQGVLRPPTDEDLAYRERVYTDLPNMIKEAAPEGVPLRFHAARIYGAKDIIQIQEISSSFGRIGGETSHDEPQGAFSVSTADTVDTSIRGYLGIKEEGDCLPLGCLFVTTPADKVDEDAGDVMLMKNVDFDEDPRRFLKVLAAPESLENVRQWLTDAGVDPGKAIDYFAYVDELAEMKAKIQAGELDPQDLVSYPLSEAS